MIVAIIPARGGSKRIPRKNIRPFSGKPIIAYSIDAALKTGLFDKIIVSTDDEEIADISRSFGADVPFVRPDDISDDHATTLDVIVHALDWLQTEQGDIDLACCLYATAPFVQADSIVDGFNQLRQDLTADFAFSVTSFAFPIQRAIRMDGERVSMFWPENETVRSQDLVEAYHDAGQFYWGRPQAFLDRCSVFSDRSIPVRIARHLVQDIDTPEDWTRAELMYAALNNASVKSGSALGRLV